MIFTYEHKIVNALVPVDGNGTALATDIINLKYYDHATFIWQFGIANTSSASSVNLIANKGEDVTTCATAFATSGYRAEATASGDTLDALTAFPATGLSIGSGNTWDFNTGLNFLTVEIDAADLAPTIANPYNTVKMTVTMSAHSVIMSCVCVLSKGRYKNALMPSAIID